MKEPGAFFSEPFPEWRGRVRAGFTSRRARRAASEDAGSGFVSAYADLNLGFRCGDDPARVRGNWKTLLAQSGLENKPLVIPRMTHGDAMVDADLLLRDAGTGGLGGKAAETLFPDLRGSDQGPDHLLLLEPEGADAVCSGTTRLVLAVTMADCLTALVFDPGCGTVAAVHAGWRGTRSRILQKSLTYLADSGRIGLDTTLVALGPCLRAESLEVGPEVAAQLPAEFLIRKGGTIRFDMPACNLAQALASGVRPEHVRDQGGCTMREPEKYFSYRRDGPASGRMAAFISLL